MVSGTSAGKEKGDDRPGREAQHPGELGGGWKDVVRRTLREIKRDNISVVAGGVAFYAFLAIFPALAAVVSLYGLIADPADVEQQLLALRGALPAAAADILGQQMRRVAEGAQGALSWGVVLGLLLTLWSSNKGMKSLMTALNIAYNQEETRGFFKLNALSLALTLGAVLLVAVAVGLIVAIPPLLGAAGLGGFATVVIDVARWPLLAIGLLMGLAVVYRLAPARHEAEWKWVTPGALFAVVVWLAVSIAFSVYVANFGNYNETYGSLGAVAILLLWFYLSAFVVLVGAEINAESEHQTRRDTTTGPDEPMGRRGAYHADTLGAGG